MFILVAILAFALVLCSLFDLSDAWRSASVLQRQVRHVMKLRDNKVPGGGAGDDGNWLPFGRDGPGYVDSLPTNLTNQSQRELIRVILGIAVLYLNFRVKVQEAYARVQEPGEDDSDQGVGTSIGMSEEDGVVNRDKPTTTATKNGSNIRYVDLREGTALPKDKETVFVSAKFLHRGLPLDVTALEGTFVTHSSESAQFMARCGEALAIPSALQSTGALQGLLNMKLGGRRHVSINLSEGLPPFVPPGGTVIAEFEMKKTNSV